MTANPIWIAGYFGPVAGASPVWIAPGDGTVPSAVQSEVVSYFAPVAGATAVWIAGFFAPPPAAIGATPITISGWGGSGGGGGGTTTSVWSASDASANGMTLSNGGLTVTPSGVGNNQAVRGSISRNSGKLYVEFLNSVTASNSAQMVGLADATFNAANQYLGSNGISVGVQLAGASYVSGGFTSLTPGQIVPTANDIFALAVDFTAGKAWVAYNNTWISSGSPATGATPFITMTGAALGATLFPGMTYYGPGQGVWTLQSTAASQKYAPPSGFSAWDGGAAPPSTSVWSAADAAATGMTLSNGGLTVRGSSVNIWAVTRNTVSKSSGKLYVEFLVGSGGSPGYIRYGLASASVNVIAPSGSNYSGFIWPIDGGNNVVSSGFVSNYNIGGSAAIGDVIAFAVDFASGSVWIARNNIWLNSSNPVTGALPILSFVPVTVGPLFVAAALYNDDSCLVTLQSTAASQKYAPPSGFSAWDSAAPVVTGHRYWRLYMTQLQTGNALYSIAEIQFRTTAGVSLLFSGGTASASTTYSNDVATFGPQLATDNNTSTEWSSQDNSPQWWTYDYGAGKSLNIVEIALQARNDSAYALMPTAFTPQWSDDGVNWTPMAQITTAPWTTPNQIKTFPVQTPSQAYLARTVGGDEGGNGANIATLIDGLVTDGVWAKLDCLYVLAQQNATDALLNLVGTSYSLTGSATFTAYKGFSAFPDGALPTGFTPTTAPSPQFTLNSASVGAWLYDASDSNVQLGQTAVIDNVCIIIQPGGTYTLVNNGSGYSGTPPALLGFFAGDRTSTTNTNSYLNGVSYNTDTSVSLASSAIIRVGGTVAAGWSTQKTLSAAFIGASLGAAGQLALYNRLRTYMSVVGVP